MHEIKTGFRFRLNAKKNEILEFNLRNSYDQVFFCVLSLYIIILVFSCGIRKSTRIADAMPPEMNYGEQIILYPPEAATLRTKYASLLDINPDEILDPRVYAFVDLWMGTPYRIGGNDHSGTDCSGFSQNLYREVFHKQIPRTSFLQSEQINIKDKSELKEGDLIFFSSVQGRVDHVGIYLGNGKFVHASTSRGVVISDLSQTWYLHNYMKGGSFIE